MIRHGLFSVVSCALVLYFVGSWTGCGQSARPVIIKPTEQPGLRDGAYAGRAEKGFDGEILVTVTNGRIISAVPTDMAGDEEYRQEVQLILEGVVESQKYDVDGVSGATKHTRGILSAVANALQSARSAPVP